MNLFPAVASDLGRTVAQARPLLMKLDNAHTSTRPAEGKWAKKEILGHLLDSASNNHHRFVRAALKDFRAAVSVRPRGNSPDRVC